MITSLSHSWVLNGDKSTIVLTVLLLLLVQAKDQPGNNSIDKSDALKYVMN